MNVVIYCGDRLFAGNEEIDLDQRLACPRSEEISVMIADLARYPGRLDGDAIAADYVVFLPPDDTPELGDWVARVLARCVESGGVVALHANHISSLELARVQMYAARVTQ